MKQQSTIPETRVSRDLSQGFLKAIAETDNVNMLAIATACTFVLSAYAVSEKTPEGSRMILCDMIRTGLVEKFEESKFLIEEIIQLQPLRGATQ